MASILPGRSFPLGAQVTGHGVHFSVYSKNASALELLLFDRADDERPSRVIQLDRHTHRTFYYWHAQVEGIGAGQLYAYRAHGLNAPSRGLRFDANKVLLDPYARGVVIPPTYSRRAAIAQGDNAAQAVKSVVVDPSGYDWHGDLPLQRPFSQTIIYELHPAGFTLNPNSGVAVEKRGTFSGLIEKIPYLLKLGVTCVELLPVYAFDREDAPLGKTNYWGYAPFNFFAPHPGYCSRPDDPLAAVDEFRDMIRAFHRNGLEVILDVVYNHTAEGASDGPTISYRGLENETYYFLEKDKSRYTNFSGTGNTLNANNPIVRRMILDSLRHWVAEMHVDGFRFDLASVLSRDENGVPGANAPVLWDIESDPYLAGAKIIAEAWDASGLYQVGSFIGDRWKEWNGKFRDDVRSFVKGDYDTVRSLAQRIQASPDLYGGEECEAEQSINFVTCHDGFTLNDLVSYSSKHNEANGENNADGNNDNRSWNHGVEGPTTDPAIESVRQRQIKNLFAYTLLALGTPMLAMGDEIRRTQQGNNNAYGQNNALSWLDWSLVEQHADLFRFVSELIRLRRTLLTMGDGDQKSLSQILREAAITWHGVELGKPDWGEQSHAVSMTMQVGPEREGFMYAIFNAYWGNLSFELPPLPRGFVWKRLIDTALPSPQDIVTADRAATISAPCYPSVCRSVVVLLAQKS